MGDIVPSAPPLVAHFGHLEGRLTLQAIRDHFSRGMSISWLKRHYLLDVLPDLSGPLNIHREPGLSFNRDYNAWMLMALGIATWDEYNAAHAAHVQTRRAAFVSVRNLYADAYATCEVCGAPGGPVHHIAGVADGGGDGSDNLMRLCGRCHRVVHSHRCRLSDRARAVALGVDTIYFGLLRDRGFEVQRMKCNDCGHTFHTFHTRP